MRTPDELRAAQSKGGLTSAARLTPEQRRKRATDAYLAGAVRTVLRRLAEVRTDAIEALARASAHALAERTAPLTDSADPIESRRAEIARRMASQADALLMSQLANAPHVTWTDAPGAKE